MPKHEDSTTKPGAQIKRALTQESKTTPERKAVAAVQRTATKLPSSLKQANVLGLQPIIGNQAISRMMNSEEFSLQGDQPQANREQLQTVRPPANREQWFAYQRQKDQQKKPNERRKDAQLAAEWRAYEQAYNERTGVVGEMQDAGLQAGAYLYHDTTKQAAPIIKNTGLTPKTIDRGGPEASKDGYMSLSPISGMTAAIGGRGTNVKLRVQLTAHDLATGLWKKASRTEVLTTIGFTPDRIEWKWSGPKGEGQAWTSLATFTGIEPKLETTPGKTKVGKK